MIGSNQQPDQQLGQAKISIVASRFNPTIVDSLLNACTKTLKNSGLQDQAITVIRVPGAFEIPSTVQQVIQHTETDAVITLGAVIRGETPHFEYIASHCANSLGHISLTAEIPVIFGILTVDTLHQAIARSSSSENLGNNGINKGIEVAQTAIAMIHTYRQLTHE